MKTAAIIQARMGSTRLPGKVLAEVAGKPLLVHQVERLERCETVDEVVVACPHTEGNWPVVGAAQDAGAGVYLGSEEDVLGRVLAAAECFGIDLIVELTADCPLIDPKVVDEVVCAYREEEAESSLDFASNVHEAAPMGVLRGAYPRGMDVRVFPREVLERVDGLTDDPADREHVSLYVWEHPREFRCLWLAAPEEFQGNADLRLTVDEPEDLALVRAIFERLYPASPAFGLRDIFALLAVDPELRRLNARIRQKGVR